MLESWTSTLPQDSEHPVQTESANRSVAFWSDGRLQPVTILAERTICCSLSLSLVAYQMLMDILYHRKYMPCWPILVKELMSSCDDGAQEVEGLHSVNWKVGVGGDVYFCNPHSTPLLEYLTKLFCTKLHQITRWLFPTFKWTQLRDKPNEGGVMSWVRLCSHRDYWVLGG